MDNFEIESIEQVLQYIQLTLNVGNLVLFLAMIVVLATARSGKGRFWLGTSLFFSGCCCLVWIGQQAAFLALTNGTWVFEGNGYDSYRSIFQVAHILGIVTHQLSVLFLLAYVCVLRFGQAPAPDSAQELPPVG